MNEVTRVLSAIEQGDPQAAEQLLPLVYDELRRLAAQKLAQEKPGQTLQATALVHEAYLRLLDAERGQDWNSRGHFFAAAAEAMRRILVDNARRKGRPQARRRSKRIPLDAVALSCIKTGSTTACPRRGAEPSSPRKTLKAASSSSSAYFAGLSVEEAAACLASPVHRQRYWAFARAWLHRRMREECRANSVGREFPPISVRIVLKLALWFEHHCGVNHEAATTENRDLSSRDASASRPERWDVRSSRACGGDAELHRRSAAAARRPSRGRELPGIPGGVSPRSGIAGPWRRAELLRPSGSSGELRHGHRPLQAAPADRRGGHGHGLHGRADPAGAADRRAQAHQGRHGQPPGPRPVRGRTPGAGPDGPPQYRQGLRRRHHRARAAPTS